MFQWSSSGEYSPEVDSLAQKLSVKRRTNRGNDESYPYRKDHDEHRSGQYYQSVQTTHEMFRHELLVYRFGREYDMADLQSYARQRLIGYFPIFIEEIRHILSSFTRDELRDLAKHDSDFAHCLSERLLEAKDQFNNTDDRQMLCCAVNVETACRSVAEQVLGIPWTTLMEKLYDQSSEIVLRIVRMLNPGAAKENSNGNGNGTALYRGATSNVDWGQIEKDLATIGAIENGRVIIATEAITGTLMDAADTASSSNTFRVEPSQFLTVQDDAKGSGNTLLVMNRFGRFGTIPQNSGIINVREIARAGMKRKSRDSAFIQPWAIWDAPQNGPSGPNPHVSPPISTDPRLRKRRSDGEAGSSRLGDAAEN
ncbi:hypothetical protein CB0940_00230 [Cercospora beticola]|uniref:Uncharacterized protein n=2 Tax=Cercospora beticola TaxID=122368 RepID=A0A2G5ICC9_CERBT|nr:hypothetical protein CB0940_00230 [Cercospora beticola]PIB02184.1 hypothetical protein CB0940_00230 [Cercospora beticola]CAK1356126.1 unnamed protein product [Cercospora beticola]